MILEPNVVVLYVDDLTISSQFYQDVLGIKPIEASITFHSFTLSNGMNLALKARHSVVPPTEAENGNGELAFTLDDNQKVDELFAEWQAKGIRIIFPPSQLPFGYTFVALDPDGQRLRVASLGKA
jgi:catechol 2,3-dioxygenase-like lactoylglutathione lyase family enzyme